MGIRPIKCECSGDLDIQSLDQLTASASICPGCELDESSFSFTFTGSFTATFNSTNVNLPVCSSAVFGTILAVTGEGVLIVNGNTVPLATFALQLLETPSGNDKLTIVANGFDESGTPQDVSFTRSNVPDDALTITSC